MGETFEPSPYRTVILDIENFPNLGWAWDSRSNYPSRQNLIDVERPWGMASFAWKWDGDKGKPQCLALPDFPKTYKKSAFDDTQLLIRLHEILDEADLVVGHNVARFDIKKINTRMLKLDMRPYSPLRTHDTLKVAKEVGLFPSNSLGALAKFLGCPLGGKIEHEGFPMWIKCMNRDEDAWGRMIKYNIQDVAINQWVYHKLRPWSKSHPNITVKSGKSLLCPVCGSPTKWVEGRWNYARSYRSKRYDCTNRHCRKSSSGSREKLLATVLS